MSLSNSQLRQLARQGAVNRIAGLRAEIASIERAFPRGARAISTVRQRRKPGHPGWNPAQRKAAARRMKKYWADRKSAKK
jgi:hypothetical protein